MSNVKPNLPGLDLPAGLCSHQDPFASCEWVKRDTWVKNYKTGQYSFFQKDVECPEHWSQNACNIVASKYFFGRQNTPERETSIKQVLHRIARTITDWGSDEGHFVDGDAEAYYRDLVYLMLHQYAAFNSPVWFNVGVHHVYGVTSSGGSVGYWYNLKTGVLSEVDPMVYSQASACFILGLEDSIDSIWGTAHRSAALFKYGSGVGMDLSPLRSHLEHLSGGGKASGAISFGKLIDVTGGTIKSGGRCLAPGTYVYTSTGPRAVETLVGADFETISYDPPANRYKIKTARAWMSGIKTIVRVRTDKGEFKVSSDHPMRLSTGNYCRAGELKAGQSLFNCAIDYASDGYLRIGLKDGRKGRERLHRLVARDILNADIAHLAVHHRDGNTHNNHSTNLEILPQSEHARLHNLELVRNGQHDFQLNRYAKKGEANGMHHSGAFWKDEKKVTAYRDKQAQILRDSDRAQEMARQSVYQRYLNTGYHLLNAGEKIDTEEQFFQAYEKVIGRIDSKKRRRKAFVKQFGSYKEYLNELSANNHRVLAVEVCGESEVYSVEVDCPTADDKTAATGHNFVIWPSADPTGCGVCVANTRRAAIMLTIKDRHPEFVDFINLKTREERKAKALIAAGYPADFNDEAYGTVGFQNANLSTRLSDMFMRAATGNQEWSTYLVTDPDRKAATYQADDILRKIGEGIWECGDPGVQFETTIQDWHTCPNSGQINSSNPCCLSGEMLIDTSEGRLRIDQLEADYREGKKLPHAFCFDPATREPALRRIVRAWRSGHTSSLVKVTTDKGVTITCTPEHKFLLYDGTYCEAAKLRSGQSLRKISRHTNKQRAGRVMLTVPSGGTSSGTVYQSRWMWEQVHGPAPRSMEVHHKNEDATDDRISNMELLVRRDHRSEHAAGEKNVRFLVIKDDDLLRVYDYLEAKPNQKNRKEMVTVARWNLAIRKLGLQGRVPIARHEKGVGIVQGRKLADLAARMKRLRVAANDCVASVERITLETPVPVYDIEVEGVHNFAVSNSDERGTATIVVHNSEYMFLDDTACNLASLRLTRFVEDGVFNVEKFVRAVRVLFRAQEILVGRVSYPTEKVAENSVKFRPLGLGYADLGALLMNEGIAYDSENGRGICGAITALMTGEAYRTSAYMASRLGAFEGFAANRGPMLRVMNKHRRAVDDLERQFTTFNQGLVDAARASWDAAIEMGEKYGYRNAQASVLAPTGCVTRDTYLLTSEGLLPVTELGDSTGARWQPTSFQVAQERDNHEATQFYVNGTDRVYELVTSGGHRIRATWKHRLRVIDADGHYVWRAMQDIQPNDTVVLRLGGHQELLGNKEYVRLEAPATGTSSLPGVLDEQTAEILGFYVGNGYVKARGGLHLVACDKDPELRDVFENWAHRVGLNLTDEPRQGCTVYNIHDRAMAPWFARNQWKKPSGNRGEGAAGAFVPLTVLRSRTSVLQSFLRGLFEADGTVTVNRNGTPVVYLSTVSYRLAQEVQRCLESLGIAARLSERVPGKGSKGKRVKYRVTLANIMSQRVFAETIGFLSARKKAILQECLGASTHCEDRYNRLVSAPLLNEFYDCSQGLGTETRRDIQVRKYQGAANLTWLRRQISAHPQLSRTRIAELLRIGDLQFQPVKSCTCVGSEDTWDISVPHRNTYIANGFVSHNTISFAMDCDTTGIEPELGLIKYKVLAGGGNMRLVNRCVGSALKSLGYSREQITDILAYVEQHGRVEGAPGIQAKDLPVFDTSFAAPGSDRVLHWRAHVDMMAAAQPFISGAISKTINMPESATVEEIREAVVYSWKVRLKANAIYRDGSKYSQPLSTKEGGNNKDKQEENQQEQVSVRGSRRKLPKTRNSITHHFNVGGHDGYVTAGMYEDGTLGEIFVKMNKEGSTIAGLMDTISILTSIGIQHGVPLPLLVEKLSYLDFEPRGMTGDPDVPTARSVVDYVFRWLGTRFKILKGHYAIMEDEDPDDQTLDLASLQVDSASKETVTGPPCPTCGSMTIRTGPCYSCQSCGNSTGGCG